LKNYSKQEVFDLAQIYYHQCLLENKVALQYLYQRGATLKQIKKHQIGYAPGGKKLTNHLLKKGIEQKRLKSLQLTNKRGNDFFFDRIMFGNPFYGREIKGDSSSPYKHLYNFKSDNGILYNYSSHYKKILLVEGHFDLLTAERILQENQFGLPVVSTYGTNGFQEKHQDQIKESSIEKFYIAYDGDLPGIKNAIRVAKKIPLDEVYIVSVPKGQDINEAYGSGERDDNFLGSVKAAKHLHRFELELNIQGVNRNNPDSILVFLNRNSKLIERAVSYDRSNLEWVCKELNIDIVKARKNQSIFTETSQGKTKEVS
jgi:DNA primase